MYCRIEGCENGISRKGMCSKHYTRCRTSGDPYKRTIADKNVYILHDNYAEIILYNSKGTEVDRTKIDINDIDKCKNHKWGLKDYKNRYAASGKIFLHRYITQAPNDFEVDHLNRDKLDNRKSNLRICTHEQNMQNNDKYPLNNSTGIVGVYHEQKRGLWYAYIGINGKRKNIGQYKNKEEAIKARKSWEAVKRIL